MIELTLRLDQELDKINDKYAPKKLTTDLQSIITASGGIAKIQEEIFNCGI